MESNSTNIQKNATDMSIDESSFTQLRQKLIVVGDVSVGKTAIVNAFIDQRFKDNYEVSD
jgi:GTPase SAR1 family protein